MPENRFQERVSDGDREGFFGDLIRELSGVLQDVVGLQEAKGLIAIVGARIGDRFNQRYRRAVGDRALSREESADAMVDLKARIGGSFYLISQSADEIVLGNARCPFGEAVEGRPSLCMMTSNVFGRIAAENLGYARVDVEEAFAQGDKRCLVRIALAPDHGQGRVSGREYFRTHDLDV